MTSDRFIVYTDGSCLNNGKKNSVGAIGIFFSDNDPDNYAQVIDNDGNKITNQTMELLAGIQAFKIIETKISNNRINPKIIYVYTDSTYVINSMTKWYKGWITNNWKTSKGKNVENKELIQVLYELKSKYIVIFKHVRSHQNEPSKDNENYKSWYGNYMADKLATEACRQFKDTNEELNENNLTNDEIDVVNKAKTKSNRTRVKQTVKTSLNC